jgi:hypothetical protein
MVEVIKYFCIGIGVMIIIYILIVFSVAAVRVWRHRQSSNICSPDDTLSMGEQVTAVLRRGKDQKKEVIR